MSIPPLPSFVEVPNTLGQGLRSLKNFHRTFSNGLTNVTKATELNKFRSLASEKKLIANQKRLEAAKKAAEDAKKVTDNLKKGNFKKVNGNLANAIGFALSLASIGLSLMTINHTGKLQEVQLRNDGIIQKDLGEAFQRAINNTLTIKKLREDFNNLVKKFQEGISLSPDSQASITKAGELSEAAKKQANDALYEVRAGREKVEARINNVSQLFNQLRNEVGIQNTELANRINEARKVGNDALYEVRAGRQKIEADVNTKFQAARKIANDALYEARAGRQKIEANFGAQLNSLKATLDNQVRNIEARSQRQVNDLFNNSRSIINDAISQARSAQAQTKTLQQRLSQLQGDVIDLRQKQANPLNIESTVRRLIADSPQIQGLLAALKAANVRLDGFDLGLGNIQNVYGKAIDFNTTSIQIVDGRITKLERGVEVKGLNIVHARIDGANSAIRQSNLEIEKINNELKQRNSVDQKQFNQLLGQIALIPPLIARVPDNTVRKMPKPLTTPQIEAAATAGVCRSTAPGGCMSNALGNSANTINQNTNQWGRNLLDKVNAGANATQLALLTKIDNKLGAQISGGISGAIKNIFQNKLVDRALQVANLTTTMHNALMLSNNLGQTLFSATNNILNAIGVKIKDEKGSEIGIEQVVSSLFLNFANSLFGAENVAALSANFKKANRIYQSASNIVDSVRSMTDSVKNVAEFTSENIGKIGNALKTYQVIAPDAYKWMPEQINAQSVWMQRLQNLEEAASGIEMVSSEVLSITQNANEIKQQLDEFNKGVEDLPPKERPDNKPVKDVKVIQKTASTFPAVPEIRSDADKEPDDA